MKNDLALFAPAQYWKLSSEQRRRLCNGCGTKGLIGILVPDTFYGLDISVACNIHDFMYGVGETIDDKNEADRVFLNNLLRIIHAKTRFQWLKYLRARRARIYFRAVAELGGPAFWQGKNDPQTIGGNNV